MLFFLFQVENVRLLDRLSPKRSRVGTLYLTATHVIFVDNEAGVRNETWVQTLKHIKRLRSLVRSFQKASNPTLQ